MEETQTKIKNAVNGLVDDLDQAHLRGMQKTMYECSARCCDDTLTSRESVEKCVDMCNTPIRKAQTLLEGELDSLQQQLQRCSMTCYDKQIQKFGPDPNKYNEEQLKTFSANLNKCVDDCATTHIALLPKIRDRFIKTLK